MSLKGTPGDHTAQGPGTTLRVSDMMEEKDMQKGRNSTSGSCYKIGANVWENEEEKVPLFSLYQALCTRDDFQ